LLKSERASEREKGFKDKRILRGKGGISGGGRK